MTHIQQSALADDYHPYVERARQHYEQHGEWPPDPLLDEVGEMRRRIMAEHGNDWRKVLEWHGERDAQEAPLEEDR